MSGWPGRPEHARQRASDPEAPADQSDGAWWGTRPPLLFAVWWFVWIVLNLVYNAATRLFLRAETIEELQFASLLTTVSDAISVLGGLLGLAVIRRTTARQEARAARLRSDIVAPPA